jgi:hypothetical protein
MQSEFSFPSSQKPAVDPYSDSVESSPLCRIICLKIYFNIILT